MAAMRAVLGLLILTIRVSGITRPTNIVLENNGYKNILVAIHPSVPEDPTLIDSIKKVFTEASANIYEATYKRVYFQDVTVLIPATWSSGTSSPAGSEMYNNADVVFTSSELGRPPEKRSYSGCGSPGIRINLTPDVFNLTKYLINRIDTLGPRGLFLVHQWARFRWGVFEEYALPGEKEFYISPTTGNIEGVRCNINQRGMNFYYVNKDDAQPFYCRSNDLTKADKHFPDKCHFYTYPSQHRASASIMSVPRTGVKFFCNDNDSDASKIHNYEAPNKQNRLCGQRSTWSVIQDSPDFKNNNNPPRVIADTTPTFKVVKAAKTRRVVLAFDIAGNDAEEGISHHLRQAAATYIENELPNTQIGITSVDNDTVKIRHSLQVIQSQADRNRLKRSLPSKSFGSGNLTDIIVPCSSILLTPTEYSVSKEIILFKSGSSPKRSSENTTDILNMLQPHGIKLHVIHINSSDSEDAVEFAAFKSGGRYYHGIDDINSTSTHDAVSDIINRHTPQDKPSSILLVSRSSVVKQWQEVNGEVFIDEDVGLNLSFNIMYSETEPLITTTSPQKIVCNKNSGGYNHDQSLKIIRMDVPGTAKTGMWKYSVINTDSRPQKVTVSITSKPLDDQRHPIFIDAGLSSVSVTPSGKVMIWTEVNKGSHPVLGMDVTAIVERQNGGSVVLELLDNGAGADITKDDGVYSRYFTQFSGDGRYSVKIEVTNIPDSTLENSGDLNTDEVAVRINTPIRRATVAGSFLYKSTNQNTQSAPSTDSDDFIVDLIPPVRITDLTVMETPHNDKTVVLQWTAPGDDLDFKSATSYDILVSSTIEDMMHGHQSMRYILQEELLEGNLLSPKESGTTETFVIEFPYVASSKLLVFSVKATDAVGNTAEKSNFVTTGFGLVPDYVHTDHRPDKVRVTRVSGDASSKPDTSVSLIIIGGILALVCVIASITFGCKFIKLRRSENVNNVVKEKNVV
ncbi:hypothetical protein LOTGIDRAFT_229149 [Lottia gigantea]|uniref:VWFA domain-containing protein n=1 Tax=Lottia gigantea TaxID=225164 RepID=V4BKZ8_LOTGI|nr:hypothetical protein LOTGIDRAFT_229149 [Lottia gigantea]ESO89264.1 hypothetical protein LOTGIDRAFT_229149 [Lottia gigantea]